MKTLSLTLAVTTLLAGTLAAQTTEPKEILADAKLLPPAAQSYKLDGPAIYKVDRSSRNLMTEDFNGDGLVDLATINNDKSLLELFLQKKNPAEGENALEKREVSLDRMVRSAVAVDVNGDGRTDLAIAAAPPRLVVMYQDDKGALGTPTETTLEADDVVAGDLTGDGHDDLLLFQQGRFRLLPSESRGISLDPSQTFFTGGTPASDPMIIDFDGDGRNDIVYHNSESYDELIVRLQSPEGTFPAEFAATSAILRQVAPIPATRRGERASVVAVQNTTRQLVQLRLAEVDEAKLKDQPLPFSEIHTIAFDPDMQSKKPFPVVADVDGDGRLDLLVASPELSVLRLLRQTKGGSLDQVALPSLQGIESIQVLDAKPGSPAPLVFYSPDEKAVGFTVWDKKENRLPFPRILPVSGRPKGLSVAQVDGKQTLVALTVSEDTKEPPKLTGYTIDGDGKLGEAKDLLPGKTAENHPLKELDTTGLDAMDVNRDGLADLVVYADFKPAVILLQQSGGTFERLSATSGVLEGLLSSARPGSLLDVDLDGDKGTTSVLAVKEKFARAFTIDKDQNVVVEQQFNGRNATSRLAGAAVGSLRGKGTREVVLLDRGNKVLTIYGEGDKKTGAGPEVLGHVDLDDSNYGSVRLFDLDADGKDDILLTADDRISIIFTHALHGGLETVASAATTIEDGGYGKVYTAKLIDTPELQPIGIEMRDNVMELFALGRDVEKRESLLRFYQFQMFDMDTNLARRVNLDSPPEPRELLAVDLNDDGKPEIACLMHDNIVIYHTVEKAAKDEKETAAGGK